MLGHYCSKLLTIVIDSYVILILVALQGIDVIFWILCFYFLAFATRLFSVLRYESVIHEFDP